MYIPLRVSPLPPRVEFASLFRLVNSNSLASNYLVSGAPIFTLPVLTPLSKLHLLWRLILGFRQHPSYILFNTLHLLFASIFGTTAKSAAFGSSPSSIKPSFLENRPCSYLFVMRSHRLVVAHLSRILVTVGSLSIICRA